MVTKADQLMLPDLRSSVVTSPSTACLAGSELTGGAAAGNGLTAGPATIVAAAKITSPT